MDDDERDRPIKSATDEDASIEYWSRLHNIRELINETAKFHGRVETARAFAAGFGACYQMMKKQTLPPNVLNQVITDVYGTTVDKLTEECRDATRMNANLLKSWGMNRSKGNAAFTALGNSIMKLNARSDAAKSNLCVQLDAEYQKRNWDPALGLITTRPLECKLDDAKLEQIKISLKESAGYITEEDEDSESSHGDYLGPSMATATAGFFSAVGSKLAAAAAGLSPAASASAKPPVSAAAAHAAAAAPADLVTPASRASAAAAPADLVTPASRAAAAAAPAAQAAAAAPAAQAAAAAPAAAATGDAHSYWIFSGTDHEHRFRKTSMTPDEKKLSDRWTQVWNEHSSGNKRRRTF